MQAAVQWMAEQDIIKLMLRSNLHQRQYMEQVRDILNILTKHQMLHEEHVQLLWDITEKVSTCTACAACLQGIGGVRSLHVSRSCCLPGWHALPQHRCHASCLGVTWQLLMPDCLHVLMPNLSMVCNQAPPVHLILPCLV